MTLAGPAPKGALTRPVLNYDNTPFNERGRMSVVEWHPERLIKADRQYGPLQNGFQFDLRPGYQVVVGANNSGKSSLLQFSFINWARESSLGNTSSVALLLPDRTHLWASTETGGRTLESYNGEISQQIQGAPLQYESFIGPARNELTRLLLTHSDYISQVTALNRYLAVLRLPGLVIGPALRMNFGDLAAFFQGSGMRSLLTILAALTDPKLSLICIDEPELSLEPRIQKGLRDLLIEETRQRDNLTIFVATHSHLFLNRDKADANHVIINDGTVCTVEVVKSVERLYDITFKLLGNDTEDLFFPGNYLVTEGASDQVICEKTRELLGIPKDRVKVLAAGGITEVRNKIAAVVASLTPLVVHDSPYANRVVALIDQPNGGESAHHAKLQADLGDRLYVLDAPSLEEYLPEGLYHKAGRRKAADFEEIGRLRVRAGAREIRDYKREISNAIASTLTADDLDAIPTIRDAMAHAANWND